jgi:protein-disulfide isomerase
MLRYAVVRGLAIAVLCSATALAATAIGNPQASVRIDLFSDFQCPTCKLLHDRTIEPLLNDYVKSGKVYLVRHEFPLPIHAHAREAASFACAADKVGKYDLVSDQLFRTQEAWTKDGKVADSACAVLSPAEAKKVKALAAAAETGTQVDLDIRQGQAEKINGTPTMIITRSTKRYPVVGQISYPVLQAFLDSLLQ